MSTHRLVIKDAIRQLIWRVISWLAGFLVVKFMSPYLGPLRYGDYSTILKYFAIWSAMADFGLYVIAVRQLGQIKSKEKNSIEKPELKSMYGKFVWARFSIMFVVYFVAIIVAYFLPAYTSNPYIVRWLPLWMIFSASFMAAGILQLPLQLFWRMKDLSVGLILARVSQIILLIITIFVLLPSVDFTSWDPKSIIAFCLILLSVVVSWLTQIFYVLYKSNKKLKLKVNFDKKFTLWIIKSNWKYWLSFYLSSFHTLIVLIFLSNFFPTAKGYVFTWIWWLGLTLIEIFLIIPSALGNSLLHNVVTYTDENKRKSFWNLMTMIVRIGSILLLNFALFSDEIIYTISGKEFLGTGFNSPWTNTILPFLGIVLFLSFIKQVFNYIFVAHEKQNKLLGINAFWVIVGLSLWLYLIPNFQIIWGIYTQVLLEIMFVSWSLFVAYRNRLLPKLNWERMGTLLWFSLITFWVWYYIIGDNYTNIFQFLLIATILNIPGILLALPIIKKVSIGLTQKVSSNSEN